VCVCVCAHLCCPNYTLEWVKQTTPNTETQICLGRFGSCGARLFGLFLGLFGHLCVGACMFVVCVRVSVYVCVLLCMHMSV
jgi:hypothetical protein